MVSSKWLWACPSFSLQKKKKRYLVSKRFVSINLPQLIFPQVRQAQTDSVVEHSGEMIISCTNYLRNEYLCNSIWRDWGLIAWFLRILNGNEIPHCGIVPSIELSITDLSFIFSSSLSFSSFDSVFFSSSQVLLSHHHYWNHLYFFISSFLSSSSFFNLRLSLNLELHDFFFSILTLSSLSFFFFFFELHSEIWFVNFVRFPLLNLILPTHFSFITEIRRFYQRKKIYHMASFYSIVCTIGLFWISIVSIFALGQSSYSTRNESSNQLLWKNSISW